VAGQAEAAPAPGGAQEFGKRIDTDTGSPAVADGWWRGFFDDAYRFLYGDLLGPVRTEREVAAVWSLLGLREGQRLLDLCCGDGRHAVPLRRRGLEVCGVDASAVLLQRGAERAARVLPDEGPLPAFVQADARALPLKPGVFDGAICLFNSIGYAGDEGTQALLREAARALRPGAKLLLECDPRERAEAAAHEGGGGREVERATVRGVPVEVERWQEHGWQHAVFRWEEQGVQRERALHHRLHDRALLGAWLEAAGLRAVRFLGGYDGRDFTAGSPVLLALGTRAEPG
jgi:SAM-dependent methyltransferase